MGHFDGKTWVVLDIEGQTHVHVLAGNQVYLEDSPAECYVQVDGVWELDGAQIAQPLSDELELMLMPIEPPLPEGVEDPVLQEIDVDPNEEVVDEGVVDPELVIPEFEEPLPPVVEEEPEPSPEEGAHEDHTADDETHIHEDGTTHTH